MSANKKLGRGLDALLGAAAGRRQTTSSAPTGSDTETLKALAVDLIQPGKYQPRQDMNPESLQELASSIRAQGVVQPIVVRPVDGGKYEIIAGERRWRATQLAGLHEVPAVIRDVPDQAAIAMALIENIQREDLNPIEEAVALNRLLDEFGLTHQQVGDAVGRSRAAVSNLLRLLQLHPEVRHHLELGALEMGHARALLALDGEKQIAAANETIRKALSVRETEALVRRMLNPTGKPTPTRDPNITRLEKELADRIGARIHIQHKNTGKGQVVIRYNSLDELDGILDHLK
ncbi:MAG: ParB/RepB/Spo0J family partition protein [Gammaproteobacteria bacterium]|nr:ParB/RepB/Spo0J family partition protein [Gammaproteobacteria bacterium]MCP5138218.1 ParB/RepB/Spo0J family partition protein [Gammaproteobacteria bacterium]